MPKNKKSIGVEIGRQIETRLLPPEKLADEICSAVSNILSERKITDDARQLVMRLVDDDRGEIDAFLL